jgi:hypothetical protein
MVSFGILLRNLEKSSGSSGTGSATPVSDISQTPNLFTQIAYSETFVAFILKTGFCKENIFQGGYLNMDIFYFYECYSTLLFLAPLRFDCVGKCWDRTHDCCEFSIDRQRL